MPLPDYDTPDMVRLAQKIKDCETSAGLDAVLNTDNLRECLTMSLPRLQLAFLHLPENDNDRSNFMVGLECEMVCLNEPCHHVEAEGHAEQNLLTLWSRMPMGDSSSGSSGGSYVLPLRSISSICKPRYGCSRSVC